MLRSHAASSTLKHSPGAWAAARSPTHAGAERQRKSRKSTIDRSDKDGERGGGAACAVSRDMGCVAAGRTKATGLWPGKESRGRGGEFGAVVKVRQRALRRAVRTWMAAGEICRIGGLSHGAAAHTDCCFAGGRWSQRHVNLLKRWGAVHVTLEARTGATPLLPVSAGCRIGVAGVRSRPHRSPGFGRGERMYCLHGW